MNPAIGRLALTPMEVKTVDVEAVFRDFRECVNTFDDWASSFWSFSALDVEQVFKVGDEVALVAPINRSLYPSSTVAKAARCVRHWASFSQMDTRYAWDDNGQVTVFNADGSQEVYVHDQRARLVQRVALSSNTVTTMCGYC